jgi:hypothetical protein
MSIEECKNKLIERDDIESSSTYVFQYMDTNIPFSSQTKLLYCNIMSDPWYSDGCE